MIGEFEDSIPIRIGSVSIRGFNLVSELVLNQ